VTRRVPATKSRSAPTANQHNAALLEWRQQAEQQDAIRRLENVFTRAAVRRLTIDELIDDLQNGNSPYAASEVVERLTAADLTVAQRSRLRRSLEVVVDHYRADRSHAGRDRGALLRRLLPKLTAREAVRIVRPLLHDKLKSRRETAYSVFRWAPIEGPVASELLETYRNGGDERLLKILVAARGSARVIDLFPLLEEFDDRYWRMRVLQATLAADVEIPERIVSRYPTEFLQAVAREKHHASIGRARWLLKNRRRRSDPLFLAWFAWAMFEMGALEELRPIERLSLRFFQETLPPS
jgi:hypothetical protein